MSVGKGVCLLSIISLAVFVSSNLAIIPGFPSEYLSHSAYATTGTFVDSKFAVGLNGPTAMEFAPDGRLFVAEKGGALKVIKNGVLLPTPFLSVSVDTRGERGLESITFDPNFVTNGYVYVYYTTSDLPNHNRVSRFTADPVNPDIALVGSEVQILNLENLTSNLYHNGGALHFGKDGKLYVSVGDNGNSSNSQTLTTRLGKILRINSDGSIPSDNPFFNVVSAKKEIWSLGLRNPFTFAFSPAAGSTLMYINDVGQNTWEEVNRGIMGANYGWPTCEGVCVPTNPKFVDPIYTYNHNNSGAAITGGVFYESAQFPPEYNGSYFFGDYVKGFIKRLTPTNQVVDFLPAVNSPIDLDVGLDGSLYYLSHGSEVHKVQFVPAANHFPHANATATPMSGDPPLTVTFDGSSSTDPDPGTVLSYSWNFGDGFSGSGVSVTHVYQVAGPIVATLTVNDGNGGIDYTSINIAVGTPPIGTIITPVVGIKYNAGDTISFNGSATDAKGGSLQASAFNWVILFHHNTHTHPFLQFNGVKNGSFTIPILGETSSDVWYRIYLTVTDSFGLNQTSTRDVIPNKSTITLASNVPGLQVNLDGQPQTTPTSFVGVVGINRTLQVSGSQILGGITYKFQSWSDGGTQNHTISTPSTNTTYTATSIAVASNPVIYMNDTTASTGQSVYSGKQIQAEYASTSSALVGKNIDTILVKLEKKSAPIGTATIGVFNADLSVKKVFGTVDVSKLATSYTDYTFSLPVGQNYQIIANDRIGIKFTGGDSTNRVSIMTDRTNAFDGTNSYRTEYTTTWNNVQAEDLYMTLKLANVIPLALDTTPPVITLRGVNPISVQVGSTYTDAGATASDNVDGNITSSIISSNTVNTSLLGNYTVTYNVHDAAGNAAAQVTRIVNVVDTTPPVITLRGSNPTTVQLGSTYTDAGATASDNHDGNITSSIISSNTVNTSLLGNYTVTYNVHDVAGNAAAQVTRTVIIAPHVPASPVITNPSSTTNNNTPTIIGTAETGSLVQLYDGAITLGSPVTATSGSWSVTSPTLTDGIHSITARATNTTYNTTSPPSNVVYITVDTVPPTASASPPSGNYTTTQSVTLSSSEPSTIYYTTNGTIPTISSPVYSSTISIPTNTTLKFFAKDTAGNLGTVVTAVYTINTVTVDATPPVITLRGSNPTTVQLGSTYTDAGATASDNVDGNITSSIVKTNTVNTSLLGNYTVTYNVHDVAGNAAAQVTRTVRVIHTGAPLIYMQDTKASSAQPVYSGKTVQAEFVTGSSSLVGKQIDTITVQLKKSGTITGSIQVGIFNADSSVKKLFGTIDASTITASPINYTVSLPSSGQPYVVQSGDRIGIKFAGGDSPNHPSIMTDTTNTFDGANSYRTYYTTTWGNFPGEDLYMTLKLANNYP